LGREWFPRIVERMRTVKCLLRGLGLGTMMLFDGEVYSFVDDDGEECDMVI
jgi:hypothetical protein